jgi:hypothetical protein
MKNRSGAKAVVAGLLTVVIVTTIIDVVMHAAGIFAAWGTPLSDRDAAIALFYRILVGISGGYVTASLAPQKPLKYGLILGGIGFAVGALGALALGDRAPGPAWYLIGVAVLAIPQTWLGVKIFENHATEA